MNSSHIQHTSHEQAATYNIQHMNSSHIQHTAHEKGSHIQHTAHEQAATYNIHHMKKAATYNIQHMNSLRKRLGLLTSPFNITVHRSKSIVNVRNVNSVTIVLTTAQIDDHIISFKTFYMYHFTSSVWRGGACRLGDIVLTISNAQAFILFL
nr:Biomphalaria glabrata ADAM family mig-17-like; transcript variant X2; misc_RNA [Biomphalaria glabrata]